MPYVRAVNYVVEEYLREELLRKVVNKLRYFLMSNEKLNELV